VAARALFSGWQAVGAGDDGGPTPQRRERSLTEKGPRFLFDALLAAPELFFQNYSFPPLNRFSNRP
jgi:hypothetical protein